MSKKGKSLRVMLIANPGSGKMTGNEWLELVTRCLQEQGAKLDVALAKPNEVAVPIARKAARDGYDVVVAMGGDDTIWAVMRGLAGSNVRMGIIPAGTENNVAHSFGIPEDPQGACEVIRAGKVRKVDLGEVKVKGRKKLVFFQMVTIGLASALYPEVKKVPKGQLSGVKDAVLDHAEAPHQAQGLPHPRRQEQSQGRDNAGDGV